MTQANLAHVVLTLVSRRRLCGLCIGLALAVGCLLQAGPARGGSIMYTVTANTSSLSGTSGAFDFEFNPGSTPFLAATATITNFMTSGTLQTTVPDVQFSGPNVFGTLPGMVTLDNSTALNVYTQNIAFGNSLSFDVTLSGPALDSPNPVDAATLFALDLYNGPDFSGAPVLTATDPDAPGAALVLSIDPTGTVSVPAQSQALTVTSATSPTPEPATLALLGLGGAVLAGYGWRARKRRAA